MKPTFTEQQRKAMDDISTAIWDFLHTLEPGQIRKYNSHYPDGLAELANEIGMEKFLIQMRDSELAGTYTPVKPLMIYDSFSRRFFSYDGPWELFAILRMLY